MESLTGEPYAYGVDNPPNLVDPSGLISVIGISIGADEVCGATWEVPGLDVATCGAAAVGTAAAGAIAVHNALDESGGEDSSGEEEEQCPLGEGRDITFGHGERHLDGTGLMPEEVESAIEEQVEQGTDGAEVNGEFRGRVRVDGHEIEYRGYGRGGGQIHIGIYYPID